MITQTVPAEKDATRSGSDPGESDLPHSVDVTLGGPRNISDPAFVELRARLDVGNAPPASDAVR